jgi:hypothetical protein
MRERVAVIATERIVVAAEYGNRAASKNEA